MRMGMQMQTRTKRSRQRESRRVETPLSHPQSLTGKRPAQQLQLHLLRRRLQLMPMLLGALQCLCPPWLAQGRHWLPPSAAGAPSPPQAPCRAAPPCPSAGTSGRAPCQSQTSLPSAGPARASETAATSAAWARWWMRCGPTSRGATPSPAWCPRTTCWPWACPTGAAGHSQPQWRRSHGSTRCQRRRQRCGELPALRLPKQGLLPARRVSQTLLLLQVQPLPLRQARPYPLHRPRLLLRRREMRK